MDLVKSYRHQKLYQAFSTSSVDINVAVEMIMLLFHCGNNMAIMRKLSYELAVIFFFFGEVQTCSNVSMLLFIF